MLSSLNLSDSGRLRLRHINGQTSLLWSLSVWTLSNANWSATAHSLSEDPSKRRLIRSDCIISAHQTSDIWLSELPRSLALYMRSVLARDWLAYISLMRCSSGIYLYFWLRFSESRRGDWQDGHISISLYCLVNAMHPITVQWLLDCTAVCTGTLTFPTTIKIYCFNATNIK